MNLQDVSQRAMKPRDHDEIDAGVYTFQRRGESFIDLEDRRRAVRRAPRSIFTRTQ